MNKKDLLDMKNLSIFIINFIIFIFFNNSYKVEII